MALFSGLLLQIVAHHQTLCCLALIPLFRALALHLEPHLLPEEVNVRTRYLGIAGQNSRNLDSLFTGNFLGHESDIADGSLRGFEFRTYKNVVGDYYVAPRFMDNIAVTRN